MLAREQVQELLLIVLLGRVQSPSCHQSLPPLLAIDALLQDASSVLREEPPLLKLSGTFITVGDIHGNVDDLLRIFSRQGYPPAANYVFLGDYIDRGDYSIEVMLILYSLKVLFPQNIYLLRGNHESSQISAYYGFKSDCLKFLSGSTYRKFLKSFRHLPYAAVLNDSTFCVHGGLSPHLTKLNQIADLPKPSESSDSLLGNDLVWSDPLDSADDFAPSDRGVGFLFNDSVLNRFLDTNGLETMIRSHEMCENGSRAPLARCVTIFSNTDYCGLENDAATAIVAQNTDQVIQTYKRLSAADKAKRIVMIPESILRELPVLEPMEMSSPERTDEPGYGTMIEFS
jgi:diadenosine tetraphosphatase ApaH/serine/threonine PP2A family protein phosphatase